MIIKRITLLVVLLTALAVFQPFQAQAANTVFTVPAEARGNAFGSTSCSAGCTGTAITIPANRMGIVFVSSSSGEAPTLTSAHSSRGGDAWELIASRSPSEPSSARRLSIYAVISDNGAASALTVTGFNAGTDGLTMSYSIAAAGYSWISQARLVHYGDPVSEGGDNGVTATEGQVNLRLSPAGPLLVGIMIAGDTIDIIPTGGEPYSELNFGTATTLPISDGAGVNPVGIWTMADDTGDSTPSITFGPTARHWVIGAIEVRNTSVNIRQIEQRGLNDINGAATDQATQVTRSMRIYRGTVVTASIGVNDGVAGDNNNVAASTIADSSGATWTEIVAGGIASPNADTRLDAWWAYFPNDVTTTITFTRGSAVSVRWAWAVTTYLGGHATLPISEAGTCSTTTTCTVTLASIASGNLGFGNFQAEVIGGIGQGTGDQELDEGASGGTNPERIQAEIGGSNVIDVGGLSNQGSGIAWEIALGTFVIPQQVPTPTPTPTPTPGGGGAGDPSRLVGTPGFILVMASTILAVMILVLTRMEGSSMTDKLVISIIFGVFIIIISVIMMVANAL